MLSNDYFLINSLSLPQFDSIDELSELTGLSTRLLFCLSKKTDRYYKSKRIPKKDGGERIIHIPSFTMRTVQKWILVNILNKILPSNQSMAFRKGAEFGNKQNAIHHMKTLYGLTIDIKDFFPSISEDKVHTIFSDLGYNAFSSTILTNLCTLNGILPQGSVCSPALSNLVCTTLDKRLNGLCEKNGILYTRYADDMYFSCDNKILLLGYEKIIRQIIEDEGFTINSKKVHYHTPSNKKIITGITVVQDSKNDKCELKAPKEFKRKIRAEIFQSIMTGNYDSKNHIIGEISYVIYVERNNSFDYIKSIKNYINNTAPKIKFYPELVQQFNSNLFFDDIQQITADSIDSYSENDLELLMTLRRERIEYLKKICSEDICHYEGWPEINNQLDTDIEMPF